MEDIPTTLALLECGHVTEVPGPLGPTTGRAWCVDCDESREAHPWPRCVDHDRPAVFSVEGPSAAFFACDAGGCRHAAERDHRVVHGSGSRVTVRRDLLAGWSW